MVGPYRAEFGAIHHESAPGFLFTVSGPASNAKEVADALNLAAGDPGPVYHAGFLAGLEAAAAYLDGRASMAKEMGRPFADELGAARAGVQRLKGEPMGEG